DLEIAGIVGGLLGGAGGGHAPDGTCPGTSSRALTRAAPLTGPAAAACAAGLTGCCAPSEPRWWTLPPARLRDATNGPMNLTLEAPRLTAHDRCDRCGAQAYVKV